MHAVQVNENTASRLRIGNVVEDHRHHDLQPLGDSVCDRHAHKRTTNRCFLPREEPTLINFERGLWWSHRIFTSGALDDLPAN